MPTRTRPATQQPRLCSNCPTTERRPLLLRRHRTRRHPGDPDGGLRPRGRLRRRLRRQPHQPPHEPGSDHRAPGRRGQGARRSGRPHPRHRPGQDSPQHARPTPRATNGTGRSRQHRAVRRHSQPLTPPPKYSTRQNSVAFRVVHHQDDAFVVVVAFAGPAPAQASRPRPRPRRSARPVRRDAAAPSSAWAPAPPGRSAGAGRRDEIPRWPSPARRVPATAAGPGAHSRTMRGAPGRRSRW